MKMIKHFCEWFGLLTGAAAIGMAFANQVVWITVVMLIVAAVCMTIAIED